MINIKGFEEEWESLKKGHEHNSFSYDGPPESIRTVVNQHFHQIQWQGKYGVYIVRRQATGEVLYIGKTGTIQQEGGFKGQDIPGRLTNRQGKISREEWFRDLVGKYGRQCARAL